MKRIQLLPAFALCFALSSAQAANRDITVENFESYNVNAVYNTEKLTVSYTGMSDAVLSGDYIINAPGGIYEGDEAYTANAAENIMAYAKTSDTTAVAVPGGLGNGWHGAYSHPHLYLQGGQGASSELNKYNRRVAVVNNGGAKVLQINPVNNSYVTTSAWYGYDEIDFTKPVAWETVVKISSMPASGQFTLSLSKGKFSEVIPFEYTAHDKTGREDFKTIVKFAEDGKLYIGDTEAGEYSTGVFYKVYVFIDATLSSPVYTVTVTDNATGSIAASLELTDIDYDFSGVTGVDYFARTPSSASAATCALIDSIAVSNVIFDAEIKSTSAVNINGKGLCVLEFSDNIDETTVSEDTINVYHKDTRVDGIQLLVLNSKRVRISLPELEPSSVYTVKINGVKSLGGIVADCSTSFRTKELVTVSSALKTSDGIVFTIRNNSSHECSVTAVAAGYADGKIVSDGVHFKKLTIDAGASLEDSFTGMVFETPAEKMTLFIVDSIRGFISLTPAGDAV